MWDASFVEHARAASPKQAAKITSIEATRKRLLGKEPNGMATDKEIAELADNIETLAIFRGHHRDVYDFNARNKDCPQVLTAVWFLKPYRLFLPQKSRQTTDSLMLLFSASNPSNEYIV